MDREHLVQLTPIRRQRAGSQEQAQTPRSQARPEDLGDSVRALVGADGAARRSHNLLHTPVAVRQRHGGSENGEATGSADEAVRGGLPLDVAAPPPPTTHDAYIWGTGIAVDAFKDAFRHFLETFHSTGPPGGRVDGDGRGPPVLPFYIEQLRKLHVLNTTTLEVDFTLLRRFAPDLYKQTVHHPTECLQMMSVVAEELYRQLFPGSATHGGADTVVIYVTACRLPTVVPLKALSPMHIETLVAIKGMVVRTSKIIPEVRIGVFECFFCKRKEKSIVGGAGGGSGGGGGRLFEPTRCSLCGKQYSFRLLPLLSFFEDKQLIRIQESPENLADGETPVTTSVVVYSDLVDCCVPGDRVVATGIFRAQPTRVNANTRIVKSVFSTHLDAVHIEVLRGHHKARAEATTPAPQTTASDLSAGRDTTSVAESCDADESEHGGSPPLLDLSDTARLDVFYRLAQRPDIYDILLRSFARAIWGHEDVKRGILCQMFGGAKKEFSNGRFRAEINIILCGDPGVAKSQLLTHVHEIAPRGVYTSGKGSSSVGLTAFVVRDTDTGEFVLEPGALVLSDRGLCCIDEFDKMNDATRSVLHEVMEQQTLSVAKAGIIAQLNARTSILAAANPKESQWNPNLNIVENLQIEPTLLSRFDLIFLLLDRHDAAQDRRLASHVLSLFMEKLPNTALHDDCKARIDDRGAPRERDVQRRAPAGESVGVLPAAITKPVLVYNGEVFLEVPVSNASAPCEDRFGETIGEVPPAPMAEAYMPQRILSQYIALARETVEPQLTDVAQKQLAESYVELRRARGSTRTVAATLRQLESMIRLAEARCKMRLCQQVSVEDVLEAKRLISSALKEAATDPRTGLINLDMFTAPDMTRNTVESNMLRLEHVIEKRFLAHNVTSAPLQELRQALNESIGGTVRPLAPSQFLELLNLMAGGDHVKSFTPSIVVFESERR